MNHLVELGPAERRYYEAARIEALESLAKRQGDGAADQAKRRFVVLAALTRLRLLACHPRLVVKESSAGSAKLTALGEILGELKEEGHRALVFSQFTSFLDLVEPRLRELGLSVLRLDGSTPAETRAERVAAFQLGQADVFLISLRAGGTGLNLTAASFVVHLDPWWNPAVEDQATDRAHRIGQDKAVTVIRLVSAGTVEEKVLAMHADKRQLAAGILEGAELAGHLDTDDLVDLMRAGADAEDEDPAEPDQGGD
jgi:SNF2 family DNA or RNA helicase